MAKKRKEYSEIKKQWPFVNLDKLATDGHKLLTSGLVLKYKDKFRVPAEKRRNSVAMDIYGSLIDTGVGWLEKNFTLDTYDIFPKGKLWLEFSKGASNIEKMYTVEKDGSYVPVFITSDTKTSADPNSISAGIKFAFERNESIYNSDRTDRKSETKKLTSFLRSGFTNVAADKYTRGDYSVLEQPFQFDEWFVRDDMWAISQFWNMKEKTATVDGVAYKVQEFSRPNGFDWEMGLYWGGGDKLYDWIDAPFDPIQKRMEKLYSPAGQQKAIEDEYKLISGVRRAVTMRRKPLALDMRGRKPNVAKADGLVVNVN